MVWPPLAFEARMWECVSASFFEGLIRRSRERVDASDDGIAMRIADVGRIVGNRAVLNHNTVSTLTGLFNHDEQIVSLSVTDRRARRKPTRFTNWRFLVADERPPTTGHARDRSVVRSWNSIPRYFECNSPDMLASLTAVRVIWTGTMSRCEINFIHRTTLSDNEVFPVSKRSNIHFLDPRPRCPWLQTTNVWSESNR